MNRWASPPLGTSARDFLKAGRSELPVILIATPRAHFKTQLRSRWREVESDHQFMDFDQVPITDSDGVHIVGVFIRGKGLVDLQEDMFMSSDAPLVSFLESADERTFRFLLKDRNISGIVTLSDIQKLPVYSVLFSLLVAVEMLLMDRIRKACQDNEDGWLEHLRPGQRKSVEKYWNNALEKNLAIDRLSCASFGQEIEAALGLGLFKQHDEHYRGLKGLAALRDQVCHAIEFAPTPEQALMIPAQVRAAQSIAAWLLGQLGGSST